MRRESSVERRLRDEGNEVLPLPRNAIFEDRPSNERTFMERLRGQYLFEVVRGLEGGLENPQIYRKVEPIRPISVWKTNLRFLWDSLVDGTRFDYVPQHKHTYYVR